MDFPYKLVALDLDGTLLGPDKTISAENFAAVRELTRLGVKVVLASGRPHHNVLPYHNELGLSGPIVGGNGAVVWASETNEIWQERFLDAAHAVEVFAEGRLRGVTQVWDGPTGVFCEDETPWSRILAQRMNAPVPAVGRLDALLERGPIYKVLWIDDPARVALHEPELRARWGESRYLTVTDPEYLEFGPLGVDKSVGLGEVCRRLGLTPADVLALGDGDNDAEMLAWAGLGLAPAHGRERAIQAANEIIPDGDPATAVARAIGQLLQR